MRTAIITASLIVLLAGGAMPAYAGQGAVSGTLLGAGLGGYFGSLFGRGAGQIATTTTGIVLGGLTGQAIGQSFDNASRPRRTTYSSAPEFFSDPPPSGSVGGVYRPNYVAPPDPPPQTPSTYIDSNYGTYCRQYSQSYLVHNRVVEEYGVVCLQPDGTWRAVQ